MIFVDTLIAVLLLGLLALRYREAARRRCEG
jgi:hypothetical protein